MSRSLSGKAVYRSMPERIRVHVDAVCEIHGLAPAVVLGRSTQRDRVLARKALMRRLREHRYSYQQIGGWLDRHHTTVMHAVGALS